MDLMPREVVRIFLAGGHVQFKHRGLADARPAVATVLAAIDRALLVEDLARRLGKG
jgi:hypothetical protein